MALNDFADRDLDRVERPERPIPSGRVKPVEALAVASGLTATGLAVAKLAGGRSALAVAVPLAASVWAYDLAAKNTAAGPAAMATARGLDVLLGAGGQWRRAALPVAAVAVHTTAVTGLSRGEVHGSSPSAGLLATAGTAAAAALAALERHVDLDVSTPQSGQSAHDDRQNVKINAKGSMERRTRLARKASTTLAVGYAAAVGARQISAALQPDAATVRKATGAGVRGIILLQSALTARAGALASAAGILAAGPIAKLASRVVSPT
jgi:4-hydroxybenzoate polyprenyltransferase